MISIKDTAEFERLIKPLSDDIVDAHLHYKLHQDLVKSIDDHPILVQQSNFFWKYTLQAHLNTSVYAIFRVYDQDRRSLHLYSWLLAIQDNLHIFDDMEFRKRLKDNLHEASLSQDREKPDEVELKKDISCCSSSDPVVNKLIIYRNNLVAHKNIKIATKQEAGTSHALTFEDLEILLERAKTILNRYCYMYLATSYSTTVAQHGDYEYIIKAVEEKVKLAEEKIKSDLQQP